ncbi:MAG TPA: GNAT family N-acetyltransferase [Solirubrobacteraceae bacterium]|jgi:predicted GNAT family acetyltransferase|nr:GNAT family N-acetyltransferase [Solirubrobacteraceae bacterium]
MSIEVRDNRDQKRYEVWTDGQRAGFAQYRLHAGRITFTHTEIDPKYEGAGLGGRLVGGALDDARVRKLVVVPACPFVADYIRRHTEDYLELVVPAMRTRVSGG